MNQAPYGGAGTPNGLLFFRGTFTLDKPTNVTFEILGVDDVALAYVDSQPIAYIENPLRACTFEKFDMAKTEAYNKLWTKQTHQNWE